MCDILLLEGLELKYNLRRAQESICESGGRFYGACAVSKGPWKFTLASSPVLDGVFADFFAVGLFGRIPVLSHIFAICSCL